MEEEDVRGDRGLSVFRLRAVSRLTLVVRCTEIGYSVSTQVLGFRFGCGWCCVVFFLFGCCWFCVLLLCVSAWWNRGIADEVTMASYGRAVTGTAVMARSANEEKKNSVCEGLDKSHLVIEFQRVSTSTVEAKAPGERRSGLPSVLGSPSRQPPPKGCTSSGVRPIVLALQPAPVASPLEAPACIVFSSLAASHGLWGQLSSLILSLPFDCLFLSLSAWELLRAPSRR